MLNHARLLVLCAHHVSGGVVEKQDGHICSITELNKLRRLRGTIGINGAVVTNEAKTDARDGCIAADGRDTVA